jgi:hypothetical protein
VRQYTVFLPAAASASAFCHLGISVGTAAVRRQFPLPSVPVQENAGIRLRETFNGSVIRQLVNFNEFSGHSGVADCTAPARWSDGNRNQAHRRWMAACGTKRGCNLMATFVTVGGLSVIT